MYDEKLCQRLFHKFDNKNKIGMTRQKEVNKIHSKKCKIPVASYRKYNSIYNIFIVVFDQRSQKIDDLLGFPSIILPVLYDNT